MTNFIKLFYRKYKLLIPILIIFILFIISYLIYINRNNNVIAYDEGNDIIIDKIKETITDLQENKIKVDVKGSVANPGVYELDENSRVIDAINLSGGLLDNADTNNINLSKKLIDQNVIIIETINDNKEPQNIIKYVYKECDCPKFNDACIKNNEIVNNTEIINKNDKETTDSINEESSTVNEKVSINNGTLEQFQSLSGIGESKAKSIIKYREENGPFNVIEDIMNISGIGEALFEKIKDSITL